MNLTNINRTFYPTAAEYAFFSRIHVPLPRENHTLSHKRSLSKFKKTEIMQTVFSDNSDIKLKINSRRNTKKRPSQY